MSWKKVNEAIEVCIDYLKRAAIILGLIILILFLFGCDTRSNEERCKEYSAEYAALSACETAFDCRLKDYQYKRIQFLFIETIEACMLSGGETDKDVQPLEEDLSART